MSKPSSPFAIANAFCFLHSPYALRAQFEHFCGVSRTPRPQTRHRLPTNHVTRVYQKASAHTIGTLTEPTVSLIVPFRKNGGGFFFDPNRENPFDEITDYHERRPSMHSNPNHTAETAPMSPAKHRKNRWLEGDGFRCENTITSPAFTLGSIATLHHPNCRQRRLKIGDCRKPDNGFAICDRS